MLTVLLGSDFGGVPITYRYYNPWQIKWKERTVIFDIDAWQYGLVFITALLVIACILGIRILGSGLADQTVRTILLIIFFIGVWTILSILALELLLLNTIIGGVIYVFLCTIYIIGCMEYISGGSL